MFENYSLQPSKWSSWVFIVMSVCKLLTQKGEQEAHSQNMFAQRSLYIVWELILKRSYLINYPQSTCLRLNKKVLHILSGCFHCPECWLCSCVFVNTTNKDKTWVSCGGVLGTPKPHSIHGPVHIPLTKWWAPLIKCHSPDTRFPHSIKSWKTWEF